MLAKKLAACGITTLYDVVWRLPIAYDDWNVTGSIVDALADVDEPCVLDVQVRNKRWSYFGGRRKLVASFEEVATGKRLDGTWMFAAHGVEAHLVEGARFLLRGKLRTKSSRAPNVFNPELRRIGQGVEPRYATSIGHAQFRKLIAWTLAHVNLKECDPLPTDMRDRTLDLGATLVAAHNGPVPSVAQDELLRRLSFVAACARIVDIKSERRQDALLIGQESCLLNCEVTPTPDQARAIEEISTDLRKGEAMRRILTGDVGTGKTWVALAAASTVIRAGGQVAYLCPTGLLAAQVHDAAMRLGAGEPLLLTSATTNAARHKSRIAAGDIAFVIGTHSLLHLDFSRLALVVIDEHHRLGVLQRLALLGKGRSVHLLSLTATPIPRTLARLLAPRPHDIAMSTLDERPLGRALATTITLPETSWPHWIAYLELERAFIVCPRLTQGTGSAVARVAWLQAHAPKVRAGLLHGGMSEREQRNILDQFQSGDITTLVATTVVEVGLDVPDATLMLIDEADRFGLAQLHQLRGRVGRGASPGHAVLFHRTTAEPSRIMQLERFAATTSGRAVAELDLTSRGPGGRGTVEQSGFVNSLYELGDYTDAGTEGAAANHLAADIDGVLAHAVSHELALIALEQGT